MESLGLIAFIIWLIVQHGKNQKGPTNKREPQQPFPTGFPLPTEDSQGQEPTEARPRNPLGFEIPHIEGAPGGNVEVQEYPGEYGDSFKDTEYLVYEERTAATHEWQPAEFSAEEAVISEPKPIEREQDENWLPLLKNPETARDAIIYAEIFGKPKALRRR